MCLIFLGWYLHVKYAPTITYTIQGINRVRASYGIWTGSNNDDMISLYRLHFMILCLVLYFQHGMMSQVMARDPFMFSFFFFCQ